MICVDKLLEGVTEIACPQSILRGFTGNIILKDWRGYNSRTPNSNYKDFVEIEAEMFSIKPSSSPEVRDDNITLYIHGLMFNVKNISNQANESFAKMTNIPVIIDVELTDGTFLELFTDSGAKILNSNDYGGTIRDYTAIECVHYHREARESSAPLIIIDAIPELSYEIIASSTASIFITYDNAVNLVQKVTVDGISTETNVNGSSTREIPLESGKTYTFSFSGDGVDLIQTFVEGNSYEALNYGDYPESVLEFVTDLLFIVSYSNNTGLAVNVDHSIMYSSDLNINEQTNSGIWATAPGSGLSLFQYTINNTVTEKLLMYGSIDTATITLNGATYNVESYGSYSPAIFTFV